MKNIIKKFIQQITVKSYVALTSVTVAGCSAMVAPDLKSSRNSDLLSVDPITCATLRLVEEEEANSEISQEQLDSVVQAAEDCAKDAANKVTENTDDTTTDDGGEAGVNLGSIENETTDLPDFTGKSVYATFSGDTGLSIVVSTTETLDTQFKQITDWECKDCSGDDDPNCQEAEAGETPSYVFISFSKPNAGSGDDFLNDADGWPMADENSNDPTQDDNEFNDSFPLPNGLSISSGANLMMGTANFTADKRPAAVGDEFEITIDGSSDGGSYAAKLTGKVFEQPTQPTPPSDCSIGDGQYLKAIYE